MLIKDLSKRHSEWVAMARSIGAGIYSEDIVQEMYIKLHGKDEEVTSSYVWFALRSIFCDVKRKKGLDTVNMGENFQVFEDIKAEGFEEAYEELTYRVNKELKSWCHYDQQLFKLYVFEGLSGGDIHRGTGISLTSIYNTINNCKDRMKAAVGEDYEDIINGDYDKL